MYSLLTIEGGGDNSLSHTCAKCRWIVSCMKSPTTTDVLNVLYCHVINVSLLRWFHRAKMEKLSAIVLPLQLWRQYPIQLALSIH